MSKVHLSKSYAVLVGLETFVSAQAAVNSGMEKVFKPKEAHLKRNEKQKDLNWELEKEAQRTRGDGMGMDELTKIATELKKAADLGNEPEEDHHEEVEPISSHDQIISPKEGEDSMPHAICGTASMEMPHPASEVANKVLSDDQHLENIPPNSTRDVPLQ